MLKAQSLSTAIIAERLESSELFDGLGRPDLLSIAEFCYEDKYDEGQALLVEGEAADRLFVIERGRVAVFEAVVPVYIAVQLDDTGAACPAMEVVYVLCD